MNILLTDDEHLARQRLIRLIEPLGEHQLFEAENGVEALQLCKSNSIDVVFLDIRMPEMDGLEAAYHLAQLDTPPAVIFVTAYDDYALKAFSVNAIDYLLKPVQQDNIEAALEKASKLNRIQIQKIVDESPEAPKRQHISARLRGEIQLIPIKDILYFQADHKYVNVKHINGEALIEEPLKNLENEMQSTFVRIHRNALVNKTYINGLSKDSAGHLLMTLKDSEDTLEVSRRHASEIRKLVKSL